MSRNNRRDEIQQEITSSISKSKEKCVGIHVTQRTGKTRSLLNFLKTLKKPKVLVAYPDNKIKQSWLDEMEKIGYVNDDIIFSNFSSLKKYVDNKFDAVIIDEAHSLSQYEIEQCEYIRENCNKMIMSSGTFNAKTQELLNLYLGMKIIYEYHSEQAIDDGIIADYEVVIHYVELDNKIKTLAKNGKMRTEKESYDAYTYVINQLRNQGKSTQFVSLARNRVSQNSISKLKYIKNLLNTSLKGSRVLVFNGLSKIADSLDIPSYHMKTKSDKPLRDFLDKKSDKLALVGIGKSGVTYEDLDVVILNGFTHNDAETSQILSRAQLLDFKGKKAIIHIICLREEAEMKKLNNSLKMINPKKIRINN